MDVAVVDVVDILASAGSQVVAVGNCLVVADIHLEPEQRRIIREEGA